MVFWLSLPMAKSLDVPPAKVGAAPSVGVWLGFPKGKHIDPKLLFWK